MNSIFGKEKELPVVPLKDFVLFPFATATFTVKDRSSKEAILRASKNSKDFIAVTIVKGDSNKLPRTGTLCSMVQMLSTDGDINVIAEGKKRVKIGSITQKTPFITAKYKESETIKKEDEELIALGNNFQNQFRKYINLGKILPMDTLITVLSTKDTEKLVDLITPQLDGEIESKLEILEEVDLKKRIVLATKLLTKNLSLVELEHKVSEKTQEELNKMQKELFLREEMKTIEKELGESEKDSYLEYEKRISAARMPKKIEERARKELGRLRTMPSMSPEVGYIRTYLDLMVDLPWSRESKTRLDIKKAERMLDEDHFGLDKVKERIAEYLAVQKLSKRLKGPILCFVGPPGTGKTSIGKSIARATGRKFVRVSLGGIRDEAEVRGHRRTYVGALPGRIIQGIKQAGTRNPVFMLDEIDKVGADFRGDPSASLLEALDPEQNSEFSDHYLEVPFDLSDVLFIVTANILDTIPPALKDRMEIIPFLGYTHDEKVEISKKFLIPKQIEINGLTKKQIDIKDDTLETVIANYTFEAGVRDLERAIATICRKVAKKITEGKLKEANIIRKELKDYLGPEKFAPWTKEKEPQIGTAATLAVTPAGGDILSVESTLMPGKEEVILTGQLGDIMKESARAALSFARANAYDLGLEPGFFQGNDVHIHVPSGAIPKDGPSAGIAIALSLISAVSKKPIKRDIAMTGEITLQGKILKIGGVRDKVLAAHRAGIKEVVLPKENKDQTEDLPEKVYKDINISYVKNIDEVLGKAFV